MKRLTLMIEMRCNSYCIFCGLRAVDPAMVKVREELGLSVPDLAAAAVPREYEQRRARLEADGPVRLPVVKGTAFPSFTMETALANLREARAEGCEALNLQGGEPTIWPGLPALIAEARSMGFRSVTVVTNGRRLADEAYARALVTSGV